MSIRSATLRPPGPKGHALFGHTLALAKDPLQFLSSCARDYGDIFHLRVRWLDVCVVCGQEGLDDVFIRHPGSFTLDRLTRGLRDALGDSLLVTDGAAWRRQRGMVLPAFRRELMPRYAGAITTLTGHELAKWPSLGAVDVTERMTDLALAIAARTALGIDSAIDRDRVAAPLRVLMKHVRGILGSGVRAPGMLPTPGNLRARKAVSEIGSVVREFRSAGSAAGDEGVLGLLRHAADSGWITESQLRDELLTMLLVGHETVALAAAYACWSLAGDEDLQESVLAEIRASGDDPRDSPDTARRAPLLKAVVKEVLRLFPPVWAMGREVSAPVEVASYQLNAGTQVLIPIWVNQRRPGWYSQPDLFRPQRWLTGETDSLPACAFFPFGAGARSCLGERLAYQELELIIAAIVSQFRLASFGPALSTMPTVTLRPRSPVRVLVERRA